MTGRPTMRRRVVSDVLRDWGALHDATRAEYRRREREASGSGDTWLATRLEVLRRLDGEDAKARIAQSLTQSPTGMFDRPAAGEGRAHARRRAGRFLSRGRAGGEVTR